MINSDKIALNGKKQTAKDKSEENESEIIQNDILELRIEITNLRNQLSNVKSSNAKIASRVSDLEIKELRKYLEEARKDCKDIHDRYRNLLLRIAVSTELIWAIKKIDSDLTAMLSQKIIEQYDQDDQWWASTDDWTIRQWTSNLLAKQKLMAAKK